MATGFDLRGFLADPSYESFSSCRKDDLVQIAAHFNLEHSQQILKRDLQGLVLAELLERELVMLPVPAGRSWRKGQPRECARGSQYEIIRLSDTITTFKSQLKTHLFKLAHNV
ncbi:unnamed protein product [Boreogadus saida]